MADLIITLSTDFGGSSPYVAAMKGVILGINPNARLIDLTHEIAPQDLRQTAFFLRHALPYFSAPAIHVIVVDPGVGTDRALLCVELGSQRLLVPDNGCWTSLMETVVGPPRVWRLSEPRYWRHPVSRTFHGRDILAPAAAHLSLGVTPGEMGIPQTRWVELNLPQPSVASDLILGEVLFVDNFGNLLSNIHVQFLDRLAARGLRVSVGDSEVTEFVRTYADARPGALVALVSSAEMLEIAVVQGSASERLGAGPGMPICVGVKDAQSQH